MSPDLYGRSLRTDTDLSRDEILYLLDSADRLRMRRRARLEPKRLEGRNIALIFEKTSTRTRCAFEVAAADQGAARTYLGPADSHIGTRSRSRTPPGCSAGCSTASNSGAPRRTPSTTWPRTPGCPSATA